MWAEPLLTLGPIDNKFGPTAGAVDNRAVMSERSTASCTGRRWASNEGLNEKKPR